MDQTTVVSGAVEVRPTIKPVVVVDIPEEEVGWRVVVVVVPSMQIATAHFKQV